MEKDNPSPLQQLDYTLLFILFLLLCISLAAIYSAPLNPGWTLSNTYFMTKQFIWYIVGSVAIVIIMLIDFDRFRQIAWYLYIFGLLLIGGLFLLPHCQADLGQQCLVPVDHGAISWYNIPVIGSFQPSEFMKIFLILLLSHVILRHHEIHTEKTVKSDVKLLGKIIILSLIPIIMVAAQPDLGTAFIFIAIMGSLLLISGIRWRIIFATTAAGASLLAIMTLLYLWFPNLPLFATLFGHVQSRITTWLNGTDTEWTQVGQVIKAIGSGQLYGNGFLQAHVFFPEAYADFIFPVIAEQFGFLGASVVISLFFLLIYRIIHAALETHDRFGCYLCTGVIGMFTFQVFQNIGMSVKLLPITGIPLPFISYGGTALLTSMIAIGLILNVRSRKRTYMFD